MPQNWKTCKLGEVASIKGGKRMPKGTDLVGFKTNHPYIRVRDMGTRTIDKSALLYVPEEVFPKISRYIVNTEDVIVSVVGTIGNVAFVNSDLDGSNLTENCNKITDLSNLDPKYLFYFLTSSEGQHEMAKGVVSSTQPKLPLYSIQDIDVPVPPLPEQKAIASILSAIDDKIENNLAMNFTLEEMAMALYKHWFVDFGPFQHQEFIDSELGSIPKGWEVKKLGELIHIKHGFAFKGKQFTQEERKELLLTPGNFEASGGIKFNWGKQKFYSGDFPEEYILNQGDLILALTDLTQDCAILGAPAIIPDEDFHYLHNQRLGLVQQQSYLTNEIMYLIANSHDFREYIRGSKTGSTVSHTSPSRIYEFAIPVPPKEQLSALNTQVYPVLQKTYSNLSENKALSKLRDTLLPKLISGEVRVKDAEQTVANAL
ncbi:MAG: restriction endonuclease subunit S [Flavobacteriales bacterium]|nr:restriction endonuclease subunit S [Flavobacteriales bacterium]